MTRIIGLTDGSPWLRLVRGAPAAELLKYVAQAWEAYSGIYRNTGSPLTERDETSLTLGLATFLSDEAAAGRQPFDGDFLPELRRTKLLPDGTPQDIGRTDLEWRLSGFAAFVVEFKVLGPGRRSKLYLAEGLARFVDGRYAASASQGALCGLVRPGGRWHPKRSIARMIDASTGSYACVVTGGNARVNPSTLAPGTAEFDTRHVRSGPLPNIALAHMFLDIPTPPPAAL